MGARVLRWVVVVLGAVLVVAGAPAAAQVEGALAVTLDATGPIEPGTTVVATVTGAPAGGEIEVRQCDVARTACGEWRSGTADGDGSATLSITVRRTLVRYGGDGGVDCSAVPCEIRAWSYLDGTGAAAPLTVTAAPRPTPTLTVDATGPLPDRAVVTVTGSGFVPGTEVVFRQCAWTDQLRCRGDLGGVEVDPSGSLSASVGVVRVVAGLDCAAAPCQVWAGSYASGDHIAAAPLSFDATSPPSVPTLTVTPATDLVHQQEVALVATGLDPGSDVDVLQCRDDGDDGTEDPCRWIGWGSTDGDGRFEGSASVLRRLANDDCAEVPCSVVVRSWPDVEASAVLDFDGSVAPPPVPVVSVAPATGLADRQVVEITVTGVEPDAWIQASLCSVASGWCRGTAAGPAVGDPAVLALAVPRLLGSGEDCAFVACAVQVQVDSGAGWFSLSAPVSFDPDAPLAPPPAATAVPATGLWDGQRIQLTGERFDANLGMELRQCAGTPEAPAPCAQLGWVEISGDGRLDESVRVRRLLGDGGGTDCAVVACSLVVGNGAGAVAVPLAFDPDGPLAGSVVVRPQPECVAWPTDGWPTAPIPGGVDAAAVQALGEELVGPGGLSSVAVFHGGRLVYETYADGIDADTVLRSFSMSKSFTATMIGLLADDGALALDDPAPVPTWATPGDPRGAITIRNLLNMASGLRFTEGYNDPTSDVIRMAVARDSAAYAAGLPLEAAPGTRFHYSTGDTQILAGIIGRIAGVSGPTYDELLHDRIFDPLGIDPVVAGFDPVGTWYGGAVTNTTTRNFAKLALLYLRGGVWEDEQFLSRSFVDFALSPSPAWDGYGGQFWLEDGGFRMVGLYGQHVHVVPELDLIVAVNDDPGYRSYEMIELFQGSEPFTCGDPLALADDDASVQAGSSVAVDVLANDSGGEVGLAPATLTVADGPDHGSASVEGGRIRYAPAPGFTGVDQLTYGVCTADRTSCPRATVTIDVRPLPFSFLWPVVGGANPRRAGSPVVVPYWMPASPASVTSVAAVPVDCATGTPTGAPSPAEVEAGAVEVLGLHWLQWATDPAWTGCTDLEVSVVDGTSHTARFAWLTPRGR